MSNKLVLFDAAGVLFPANTVVNEALIKTFHLNSEQLTEMWNGLYKDLSLGKINTATFIHQFAETYNLQSEKQILDVFTHSFEEALEPMPGIENIIKALSEKTTLALLSDTTEIFKNIRNKLPYFSYFDKQFLSYELGVLKPDAKAYQAVLDYYDVKPSEVFFIDDRAKNVEGAQQLGIDAELFINADTLKPQLKLRKLL
ncbi:MAG: hypothetical protein NVS1B7_8590 [Candidatus Saccharimonadales bacterium]